MDYLALTALTVVILGPAAAIVIAALCGITKWGRTRTLCVTVTAPKGWIPIDIRPPMAGEHFISTNGEVVRSNSNCKSVLAVIVVSDMINYFRESKHTKPLQTHPVGKETYEN